MFLQEKRILCDVKEPDKNHLWLRPRLDRDGYDLLYWGSRGWTLLIDCLDCPYKKQSIPHENCICKDITSKDTLTEIPDKVISEEGGIYEINTPSLNLPEALKPSCGCPDLTTK